MIILGNAEPRHCISRLLPVALVMLFATSSAFAAETPSRLQQCIYNTECIVVEDVCGRHVSIAAAWARDYVTWLKVERARAPPECSEANDEANAPDYVARCENRQCRLREKGRQLR